MAWLNTTPEKKDEPRSSFVSDDLKVLPEIGNLQIYADYLFEIGLFDGDGNPIGHQQLYYFQKTQHVPLAGWEVRLLINVSRAYCAQLAKAKKRDCPPPYSEVADMNKAKRDAVCAQMYQIFERFNHVRQ